MTDIIDFIRAHVPLDVRRWHKKVAGTGFIAQPTELRDEDLEAHVRGDFAIATRHPTGTTEHLIFDLDAKDGRRTVEERDETYRLLRAALPGTPFVMQSPGRGLHVYYRTESIPVDVLQRLAAEACEAAGLPPAPGILEIFPRTNACFRVPFGAGTVILDPGTLVPIAGADLRQGGLVAVRNALHLYSEWVQECGRGLVEHLRELAATNRSSVESGGFGMVPSSIARDLELIASAIAVPGPPISGLTRSHSRYMEEWRIGVMMWRFPAMFAQLGLPASPSRTDIARGLVAWLELGADGFSAEWAASLARGTASARAKWMKRYLKVGGDGLAPVDRMLRAALTVRAFVTGNELRAISAMSHTAFGCGIERYRFEVWWTALLLHIKQYIVGAEGELNLCASLMRSLPFGKQYRRYLDVLEARGRVKFKREYLATRYGHREPRARGYRVHGIDTRTDLRPLDLRLLEDRLRGHVHRGRSIAVAEAVHAVRTSELFKDDLRRRYGPEGARHVRRIAGLVSGSSSLSGF